MQCHSFSAPVAALHGKAEHTWQALALSSQLTSRLLVKSLLGGTWGAGLRRKGAEWQGARSKSFLFPGHSLNNRHCLPLCLSLSEESTGRICMHHLTGHLKEVLVPGSCSYLAQQPHLPGHFPCLQCAAKPRAGGAVRLWLYFVGLLPCAGDSSAFLQRSRYLPHGTPLQEQQDCLSHTGCAEVIHLIMS